MLARQLQTIAHALVVIAFLLALIAGVLWLRPDMPESRAEARSLGTREGIPDSGHQRQAMIQELRALNERLAAIEQGLKDGEYQVKIVEPKAPEKR